MSNSDYDKALRMGQKEYHAQLSKGAYPYLPVLDDLLSHTDIETRTELGLLDIPLELIVGTSTQGRTTAFATNFMPLLKENTEFASKWIHLSDSMLDVGQREPIKAYEFMNRFYVVEGNKRVSVSKYIGAVSVYGTVTRFVPKKTDDKDVLIYYEFIEFYNATKINYIWFSKEGSFKKLLDIVTGAENRPWTEDECAIFKSNYLYFKKEFEAKGGNKLEITIADAMLAYINIYGYADLLETPAAELRKNMTKIWDEFLLLEEDETVALLMDPNEEPKKNIWSKLMSPAPGKLKVAFIHDKSSKTSAWTYGHELGRMHIEQVFKDHIETKCIENVLPDESAEEVLEQVIAEDYDIIFTTTPQLMGASLKAAINHPDKKILNCSLNTSHRYIRTYYGRLYEAKFITGAIAGALSENDKIGYIADYPIYGMTANINAFALGAKMVNPRAKVYLEWSTVKDRNIGKLFSERGISYISNKEMVTPQHLSRQFGLYYMDGDTPVNLAMPIWHWGVLYEKLLRSMMSGAWKSDDAAGATQALNYWWGMSAGVIDVICSQKLPAATAKLVDLLKKTICSGDFNPFSGALYSQDGVVLEQDDAVLMPEDIITMDWLAENVIGSIPTIDELKDEAKPIVLLQGLIDKY